MQPSISHTLSKFWNGKRFIILAIFSLMAGNIVAYVVGSLAEKQLRETTVVSHGKIFSLFNELLEQEKKTTTTTLPVSDAVNTVAQNDALSPDFEPSLTASFWGALKEVRKQFPSNKAGLITDATADNEREKKILTLLKNRPKGWKFTELEDGWLRSYFVLPTKSVSSFEVVSYVRDELQAWKSTAVWLGLFTGLIFLAFGWFWSRALDQRPVNAVAFAHVDERIEGITRVIHEMGVVLVEMEVSLEQAQRSSFILPTEKATQIAEYLSQMKMLVVNGTIEAGRTNGAGKIFVTIFQELAKSIESTRVLLKDEARAENEEVKRLKQTLAKASEFTASVSKEPQIFSPKRSAS